MLAARDQENLVHARQTTAAAKPQNQGAQQLRPKTPGNKIPKTPFKIPLNDENDPLRNGGKTGIKTNGKGSETVLKSDKTELGKSNLVTPSGPQERAPLGVKTTNAKSKAFQTPAPLDQHPPKTQKRSSTRKQKIHHDPVPDSSTVNSARAGEDAQDMEYMPPQPTPMTDRPLDITYDDTFPQLKGENKFRGWWHEYANQKGEDGLTDWERKEQKEQKEYEQHVDALIQKSFEEIKIPGINVRRYPDEECLDERDARHRAEERARAKIAEGPSSLTSTSTSHAKASVPKSKAAGHTRPDPSTLRARNAASALSRPTKSATTAPPKGKPTTAQSRPKVPRFLSSAKPNPSTPVESSASMQAAANPALSRQTLGYSKGRSISASMKPALTSSTFQPPRPISGSPKQSSAAPSQFTSMPGMIDADTIDPTKMSVSDYIRTRGVPATGSEMWYKAIDEGYFESFDDAMDGKLAPDPSVGLADLFKDEINIGDDEDGDCFQLSMDNLP